MRRILQVSPHYPPLLGGLERVVQVMAIGLAARHEVSVLTTTTGASGWPRRAVEDGVRVTRCRAVHVAHTSIAPGMIGRLLRVPRGTVVHLHCSQALVPEMVWLSMKARRMPYVVHFHMEVDASGPLGRLLPVYKKHLFGRTLRGAAAVIALTQSQAVFLEETYGVEPSRVFVVPNGVATEFFAPARTVDTVDAADTADAAPGPLRLLYVGRLGAQKNVARLLEAMKLATESVRLSIVGDGELRESLQARAAELGLGEDKVEFCGRKDGADLLAAYADAEAFVLPSDREGMALVAVEAMASGLPVLATAVPGNIELLNGVGLLVDPTARDLAEGIDRLAADGELRAEIARRCRERAASHNWDTVIAAVEGVYDKAGL